jgi:hypothetical protein
MTAPYPHQPASTPSRASAAGLTAPTRAGRGAAGPPSRHARRGPARARGAGCDRGKGQRRFYPFPPSIRGGAEHHRERHLPRPANGQGHGGLFPPSSCSRRRFKRSGPVWHGSQATHPLLGFSLPPPPVCTGLGEEAGAPPPHRAGQGRSQEPDGSKNHFTAGTPSTRPGGAAPRRRGKDVNQLGTRSRSRGG